MSATVLLVDDEPHVIEALEAALRREPYTVLGATSGEQALTLLARHPVDVVISDEQMPGMKGSELLAEVRERFPETVRIVLTGQAHTDSAIAAINNGEVYRYLLKPCRAPDLVRVLKDAMRQRARNQAAARFFEAARKAHESFAPVASTEPMGAHAHSSSAVEQGPPADVLACLSEQERALLSRRESEVLRALVTGQSVKEIAKAHYVSPHTVRNHVKAIYRKLDVHSQRELMRRFVRGPLEPGPSGQSEPERAV